MGDAAVVADAEAAVVAPVDAERVGVAVKPEKVGLAPGVVDGAGEVEDGDVTDAAADLEGATDTVIELSALPDAANELVGLGPMLGLATVALAPQQPQAPAHAGQLALGVSWLMVALYWSRTGGHCSRKSSCHPWEVQNGVAPLALHPVW